MKSKTLIVLIAATAALASGCATQSTADQMAAQETVSGDCRYRASVADGYRNPFLRARHVREAVDNSDEANAPCMASQ
jgi:hypothetical protein